MKHALAFVLVLLAAACGGSQKPAAAKGPTCADAAAHTREMARAAPDADPAVADMVSKVIGERCAADAWSAEAVGCMATATEAEMAACPNKLTDAQRDAFVQAIGQAANPCGLPPAGEFDNPCGE